MACFRSGLLVLINSTLGLTLAFGQTVVLDPLPAPLESSYTLELGAFATHSGAHAIDLTSPRDGSGNVYVSTQSGQIFGYDSTGSSLGLFLDLAGTAGSTGFANPGAFVPGQNGAAFRGLMYFDFHPDFGQPGAAGEGKVYTTFQSVPSFGVADYTAPSPGNHYVIAEWEVSGNDPNTLDLGSYREVMRLAMSGNNPHAIGKIGFNKHASPTDADYGLLYAAIGDAGTTGNVAPAEGYIQEIDNPFGKIIRIDPLDPDGAGGAEYSVPSFNPFVGVPDAAEEIYALGFRDPQTFSFAKDGLDETVLVTFDIGATQREEVNLVRAGQNYGWVQFEGTLGPGEFVPDLSTPTNDGFFRDRPLFDEGNTTPAAPVLEYDHISGGFAIAGGLVVSDPNDPGFQNQVIFGDLVRGKIFHADYEEVLAAEVFGRQATIFESEVTFNEVTGNFADVLDGIPGGRGDARFGADESGNVYIVSKRTGTIFSTGLVDASAGPFNVPPQLRVAVNRLDGTISVTNLGGGVLNLEAYEILSANGLLNAAGWSSLADQGEPAWQEAPQSSENGLAELNPTPGASFDLAAGETLELGAAYSLDPAAAMAAVGFGQPYEDVVFRFSEPGASRPIEGPSIEYTGPERINNLVLEVNTATGEVSLVNESALGVTIDFFQITSDAGALDSGFSGLTQDGTPVAGWETAPSSAVAVAQFFPTPAPGYAVAPGEEFDLGTAFIAGDIARDLEFLFHIAGGDPGGFAGAIRYINTLPGDFNGDGLVDAADYTVWRDNFGSQGEALIGSAGDGDGTVGLGDYTVWVTNFGRSLQATLLSSNSSAVPEPTSALIVLAGFLTACRFRHNGLSN